LKTLETNDQRPASNAISSFCLNKLPNVSSPLTFESKSRQLRHKKYSTIHKSTGTMIKGAVQTEQSEVSSGRKNKDDLEKKKIELIEKVKEVQENISIEGAKVFSKCFISAMHSIEELDEGKSYMIKILIALHNNWRNFLDLIQKKIMNLKSEVFRSKEETKQLQYLHRQEVNNWGKEIEKQKAKYETRTVVKEFNDLKKKYQQLKIQLETEKKDSNAILSLLKEENEKLREDFNNLKKQADIVKNAARINNLTLELSHAKEQCKKIETERENIVFKLGTLVTSTKNELVEKSLLLSAKLEENNDLEFKYKSTQKELEYIRNKLKTDYERVSMANEDMLQSKIKMQNLKQQLKENKRIMNNQKRNIRQLELQMELQQEGLIQKKSVQIEGTLFHFVWEHGIAKSNNENASISKQELSVQTREGDKKQIIAERIESTGEVRLDTISLKKFVYSRPTYRSLVDNSLPKTGIVTYLPPFPIWLQITIRAIFDSLLNELLLSTSRGKTLSRFPEYVYAWLGVFTVDDDTGGIKWLQYTERETIAKKSRCDILLGLEATSASNHWELMIFREFLEEQLGLDELVYFLHCRFILFRGAQLAIAGSRSCIVPYVTKRRAFDTIDRVMYYFPMDEKELLKKNLEEFAKETYKNPDAFDAGMVLRILLEFYQKEKKQRFAKFEAMYLEVRHNSSNYRERFSFNDFQKIIIEEYEQTANDLDMCNVYRQSYIAGGCTITCDSLLLAFCETPFYIHSLRLRGQNNEPKYDNRGDIDQSNTKGKECFKVLT